MKILVTGVTGKLGSIVVETLLETIPQRIWLSASAIRRKPNTFVHGAWMYVMGILTSHKR